jgi:hypothetical protein
VKRRIAMREVKDIMLQVILAVIYFVLIFPLGVALRIVRDPMARKWRKSLQSYRVERRGGSRIDLLKTF